MITDAIVANDDKLGSAIDEVTLGDPRLVALLAKCLRRQRLLRAVLDDNQWAQYMLLEDVISLREALALGLIARTFYAAGKQSRK